jgi:hypothetical protein
MAVALLAVLWFTWPSSAHALGSYDNAAIADKALTYWNGINGAGSAPGATACQDANKPGDSGGQCRAFVNCVVWMVSGHGQNLGGSDYFTPFTRAGSQEISNVDELRKGDIVQNGQGIHTFIIVSRNSDGRFMVVDSNHANDEKVWYYARAVTLNSTERAFRMGTIRNEPPPPLPPPTTEANLLRDGGFEGGGQGWAANTNYAVYNDSARAHDGSWFAEANVSADAASIWQDVPVNMHAGDSVTFSIWARLAPGVEPSGQTANLCLWSLQTLRNACYQKQLTSGWQQLQATATMSADTSTLRAQVYLSGGGNFNFDGATLGAPQTADAATTPEVQAPPSITGDAVAGSRVSCDGATWRNDPTSIGYRWFLDGQLVDGATEQSFAVPDSAVGQRLVCEARAGNDAGSAEARSDPVRVLGILAPQFDSAPGARTKDATPTFRFSADGAKGYQCSVDSAAFAACESPLTIGPLAEGAHDLRVRAVDRHGRTGPAARAAFVVDLSGPETAVTSAPSGVTRSTSAVARFSSSEVGSTFQCRLDGSSWTACTSPKVLTGLAVGAHTFLVRAIDRAGNADRTPATVKWRVDMVAPETRLVSGPPAVGRGRDVTIRLASSEPGSSFQCRLGGGSWEACGATKAFTGLADGSYAVYARAVDQAGNVDATPLKVAWRVDTTAPETTITGGPAAKTTARTATLRFKASEAGSSFQCRLDGGTWSACTSHRVIGGLAVGKHAFFVRATDAAGNTDRTPVTHTWTIT